MKPNINLRTTGRFWWNQKGLIKGIKRPEVLFNFFGHRIYLDVTNYRYSAASKLSSWDGKWFVGKL